jgi:hypothetical protein
MPYQHTHYYLMLLDHSMPASLTAPDLTTTENVASMRPIMEEKVQNNTCAGNTAGHITQRKLNSQ